MTLFVNATIRTLDPENPHADALLTSGGDIIAVGQEAQLRAHVSAASGGGGPRDRHDIVDLGGDTVLPGMVDAHLHTLQAAEANAEIDIATTPSLPEAVEAIRSFATGLPVGQWVTGGRWDFTKWGLREQPTREVLDAALPDIPVALSSIDYHTVWCNSAALRLAGIDRSTPDPSGGQIARDSRGEPTGILREDAAGLVFRVIPELPLNTRVEALEAVQRQWLSEGLTTVHDIDGQSSRLTWEALRDEHRQHIRSVKFLRPEEMAWAAEAGWHTGGGTEWIRNGGLKLFSDGALGSKSSHMSKPYPHAHSEEPSYGIALASEEELLARVREAYGSGIVPVIHAIGDQANHIVLNVFEASQADRRDAEARLGYALHPRIEHAQFLQPADVRRLVDLDVTASMQPRHCISDLHLLAALKPDPSLAAYAWVDIERAGGRLAFGSDGPVEPTNPFAALYAAMTRADISGDPATTFQPERRMSAYRAVTATTQGPAHSVGQGHRFGTLRAGFAADFIAVNTDPLAVTEFADDTALFEHATAVRDTVVNTTVVGGQIKFRR